MVLVKRIQAVNVAPKQTAQVSTTRHRVTETIEYIACLHANAHKTPYVQATLVFTALAFEFVNRRLVIPGNRLLPCEPITKFALIQTPRQPRLARLFAPSKYPRSSVVMASPIYSMEFETTET